MLPDKYPVASFNPCSPTSRKEQKSEVRGLSPLRKPDKTTCQKDFVAAFTRPLKDHTRQSPKIGRRGRHYRTLNGTVKCQDCINKINLGLGGRASN